jgi:methylated-DNA-[protein]-cysteine S-methyltransferase
MVVIVNSPVGPLSFEERDGAIVKLDWANDGIPPKTDLAKKLAEELEAYFAGELKEFTVPVRPRTGFPTKFAAELMRISYGETKTYGDLAAILGVSAQAAGQACGANTIPIIIPCHRVLGASSLGGFSGEGGIEAKVALLKLEGAAGLLI